MKKKTRDLNKMDWAEVEEGAVLKGAKQAIKVIRKRKKTRLGQELIRGMKESYQDMLVRKGANAMIKEARNRMRRLARILK